MNLAKQTELMMRTHLKDPQATLASVGVIYGMLIGTKPGQDTWLSVNAAIKERFAPGENLSDRLKKLDAVKVHGWRFYEAMAEAMKSEA